jgi:hypothetical protein
VKPGTRAGHRRDDWPGAQCRASPADVDQLVAFNADIHREGAPEPSAWIAAWTRDLAERPHPAVSIQDFLIVEDTHTGKIVSSLNLISQTWSYAGIPFGVGRPELVGTHPDYRRRGLVRRQFEVIHRWSSERGELVQAITGIPWYYRQFGYEMALELDGARQMPRSAIPKLADGQSEPYRVRPAALDDIPFVVETDLHSHQRYLVAALRDERLWRLELDGRSEKVGQVMAIVESLDGERVGFILHGRFRWASTLNVIAFELRADASWLHVSPTVLRYLGARGEASSTHGSPEPFETLSFVFGTEHPLYQVVRPRLARVLPPYAFFVRVPDIPIFLHRIAPVLERRLERSVARGYSGELLLSFYRSGLRLCFDRGRLTSVDPFTPTQDLKAGGMFPELTFLQLLFGWRARKEIEAAFPDCRTIGDDPPVLIDVLFPKLPSHVLGIQ